MELEDKFMYIYVFCYNNIDKILSLPNISPYLDTANNSYLSKLVDEYPNCDTKVLQAFCFSIYYTIYMNI